VGTRTLATPLRARRARRRQYLLADPAHLDVAYAINPWMDPSAPFDPERATAQWGVLRRTLEGLGHDVTVLPAAPGLPDLVFAANGALVVGDVAVLSRFRHPERTGEEDVHRRALRAGRRRVVASPVPLEGEGDVVVTPGLLLAGHPFRSDVAAHALLESATGVPVLDMELVDERFYHLDTAVGVAADDVLVWHPPAVSEVDGERFRRAFPDAIEVDEHDAALLGCNLVGDGRHVVVPAGVDRLASDLRDRGLEVLPVALDELLLAGGGPKCCVAEWHPAPATVLAPAEAEVTPAA
jgi:N-dimethylarginine dimethylaminohydrolase